MTRRIKAAQKPGRRIQKRHKNFAGGDELTAAQLLYRQCSEHLAWALHRA
jgi:hypothetical protein